MCVTLVLVIRRDAIKLLPDRCRRRRRRFRRYYRPRRRRRCARCPTQRPDGDGGRRQERAACRRGVDGDAAANARGAYAARGRSKSRRRLDIVRRIDDGDNGPDRKEIQDNGGVREEVRRTQISIPESGRGPAENATRVYYPRDESLWPPAPPATTDRTG